MSDRRRLVFSILKFCSAEMQSNQLSDDAKESLEVASQCLQSAYALNLEDKHLDVSQTLEEIFKAATLNEPLKKKGPPSAADKEEAERLKTEGNNLMRTEKFTDALLMYSKAIELDGSNPVFYCNRAAAHSKMNSHHLAIEDCQRAVDMDATYSKAYGRMGLANSSLEKHKEAVDNFKKALELEPDNESYKSNLQIAEDKVRTMGTTGGGGLGGMPGLGGLPMGPGGFDLGGFLNNPALMNMASTMLQDPNMQNMMSQMMGGGGLGGLGGMGGGPGVPTGSEGGPPPNIEGLLQAGQQLAQQMQASNPELVEQLRRQMMGGPGANPPGPNNQPPPGNI
ncbi:small glutamine-rich tetratricopeptide repeat-containing protein alpha [Eurytemora carolleeae]|uniref:small glutamine-rich tetratricopeptide repeat-containing protein alpha n=1 Tax=Eurytemora carolleeae TaxID=1294199 RepID=UPI000C771FCC|nr:small glutamine-rich tetratricopeptide repeat-containing protein alpha [Eurytemora carolleeae]|eukprot:XP_023346944.1 small glutamine-rich tetratricopeptide repeat-containing protein alpha-like [Eurytemora affinis]